ncbi:hypothetical protein L7F22_055195 [Adiantum nelumboides]|nr:hypothetical protein [Adiantum nelumboides]
MLEDDEPGELPLMRNLQALKQPKESPALKARSRKSPAVESTPSIIHEPNFASLDSFDHDWDAVQEHNLKLQNGEGGVRRDGAARKSDAHRKHAHSRTGPSRRSAPHINTWDARVQSPYENDLDSRMSWDLGAEVPAITDTSASEWHIRRNSRAHDGIFDETHRGSHSISQDRTTEWVSSSAIEDFGSNYHAGFFGQHQDEDGRLKALQKTSKLEQGHKQWRQSDQILSPLILNPKSDVQRSTRSNIPFILEDPMDGEEDHSAEHDRDYIMAHQRELAGRKAGTRSRSPLSPQDTRSFHRKQASGNPDVLRSPQIAVASMNRQLYSEYSRVAPSESEFFEYEVDSMELPGKRENGRTMQRPKQSKGLTSRKEERRGPPTGPRRQGRMRSGHQSEQVLSSNHPATSPVAEPLPLLTELEDDNGSEENGGTSVDGELGRLAMSELHGELELVACNTGAPDRNNAGRLVKVADAEHLQLSVQQACKELALCDYKPRNLSQKYRPKVFEDVVGQHIVAQALSNAILRSRIAPVYLFQGSRGTGKTSAARIFAAALICSSQEGHRPCGACRECVSVATGKCSEVREVDAASNNGVERVKVLLEETISAPSLLRYKVFVIDECHVLTTETWNCLLKILEEPPMNVVFILITTDADQLPRTVVSRCQKFPFPKIKDSEIVKRLQKLASLEDLAIDAETLQLIASRSEGSLRDAETILDQVSLLGQQINSSTVYQLVGSVSDDRLLGLLNSALMADTISTVRRARELVDSGVEPLSLMSRLATLITDILAGTFKLLEKQRKGFFRKQSLSEMKLERLRVAMKTLSEAEKQLRTSNDRTTWLIAALLQLGPERSLLFPASYAGSSISQSPIALDENEAVDFEHRSSDRQTWPDGDITFSQNVNSEPVPIDNRNEIDYSVCVKNERPQYWTMESVSQDASHGKVLSLTAQGETPSKMLQGTDKSLYPTESVVEEFNASIEQRLIPSKLNDIWSKVVERCQSNPLRQLLYASMRLISISISEVDAVVHLEVCNPDDTASCERSQKRIANLFELVLGFPVEIKMSLASLFVEAESPKTPEDNTLAALGGKVQPRSNGADSKKGYEWSKVSKGPNATESFPGTTHGAPSKVDLHPDSSTASWRHKPIAEGGRFSGLQDSMGNSASGESQETRRYALSKANVMGVSLSSGERQARRHVSRNDLLGGGSGNDNDLKEELDVEAERELGEIELLSPEFNDLDGEPHEKNWRARHSTYEGPVVMQLHSSDGRRSSDADSQRRKGSHLNMVRRMSIRNRIRSLPSSDPNSPDRAGGANLSLEKGNEKSNDGQQLVADEAELAAGDAGETSSTTQKRAEPIPAADLEALYCMQAMAIPVTDDSNSDSLQVLHILSADLQTMIGAASIKDYSCCDLSLSG